MTREGKIAIECVHIKRMLSEGDLVDRDRTLIRILATLQVRLEELRAQPSAPAETPEVTKAPSWHTTCKECGHDMCITEATCGVCSKKVDDTSGPRTCPWKLEAGREMNACGQEHCAMWGSVGVSLETFANGGAVSDHVMGCTRSQR